MFIKLALQDPFFYFIAVFTLIGFIVLHELAHGVVAISEGDDTPHETGHITLNPIRVRPYGDGFTLFCLSIWNCLGNDAN